MTEDVKESSDLEAEINSNYSEVNQSWNVPSTATHEPIELGEVMRPSEAAAMLGVVSSKVTLLHRKGVLRRYNAKYWGGYLKSDVEKLMRGWRRLKGNKKLIRKFENDMARDNMHKLVANLPRSEYHRTYQDALADPSRDIGKLFVKLPAEKGRPKKHDSLYQYLYLTDNDTIDMKLALIMRDAVRKNTSGHVRFAVNRVSLPPVKSWHDPRHQNIVKFLVDAASELYGIDFDVMSNADYNSIAMSEVSTTLMSYLNGRTIGVSNELGIAIEKATVSGDHIPLVYRVDYWYRCMDELITTGRFFLNRSPYVDNLLRLMLPPNEQDNIRAQADMKDSMDKATGAYWWEQYDSKWLPVFLGELPYIEPRNHKNCFELNPKDKRVHPEFDPSATPEVIWLRNKNAQLQASSGTSDANLEELQSRLMHFHTKAALMVRQARSRDFGITAAIIKSLTLKRVHPEQVYLYPFEDPTSLLRKMPHLEAALEDAAESLGIDFDDGEVDMVEAQTTELSVDEHSSTVAAESYVSPDGEEVVTDSDRLMSVHEFYSDKGLSASDGDSPRQLLDALTADQIDELNRHILRGWGYDV